MVDLKAKFNNVLIYLLVLRERVFNLFLMGNVVTFKKCALQQYMLKVCIKTALFAMHLWSTVFVWLQSNTFKLHVKPNG